MPVDLSRVGLEGIETAQQTLNAIEARKASEVNRLVEMGEFEREERDRQIDQEALTNAMTIAKGQGVDISAPDATAEDFGTFFDILGTRYAEAGAPKRAKEFIEAGIDYRKKAAEVDAADDEAAKVRLDNMFNAADWVARNIGENESEYQLFLSNLDDPDNPVGDILGRDNVEVLKQTPWSPDLSNFFRSKALSVKDQAQLEMTARGQARMERSLENTEQYRNAMLRLGNARLEEQRRATTLRQKESGPDVGKASTNAEIGTAKSVIFNTVKVLEGQTPDSVKGSPLETAVNAMAEDVAARAKMIVAENKGLTYAEAVNQAVGEAEAAGEFGIIEPAVETGWFDFAKDKPAKVGYKRRGRTPDNPIPLPQDRKKWVRGRYYEFNGKVGKYGEDFE